MSRKRKDRKYPRIARELNYIPDSVAMELQEQKTKQIIFLCNDIRNPFYIQMYQGMLDAAKDLNYRIVLDGNMELSNIRNVLTDGIIFLKSDCSSTVFRYIWKKL